MKPEIKYGQHISNWKYYKIGELCELLTGFPFPGCQIVKTGKNLLMRGINITEGYIRHSEDIDRYYDGDTTNLEKYRLKTGDLVIGMDGSKVGKNSALITSKENNSLLVQRVARLRNKDRNLIRLIQITVNTSKFLKYIEEMKTSSAIPHISPTDIKDFTISLPTDLNERNLLASYFQSLDSLIQTTSKKLASLKQIKAASLQSMFPQEGETVPKVRFKGFEEEWEKIQLNKCLDISNNINIHNTYGINDVLSISDEAGVVNQIEFLGRSFAGKSLQKYKILKTDQLVYTKSPLKAKPYGIIKKNSNRTGIVSTLYAIYDCKDNVSPEFIHYYFDPCYRINQYLSPLVNKGAKNTMNISDETALSGEIWIPSLQEQQKIASYFYNLDKQISLQTQCLEKLKQIKAACLDKMFV